MDEFYRFFASAKSKVYASKILNREDILITCEECGIVHLKHDIGPVDLLIDGKGKYPDLLLCGEFPLLIVSHRVVRKWEENNIRGFEKYSVRLFRHDGEEIAQSEIKYYHVIITGLCELDLDMMGIRITNKCDVCGNASYNKETWEFGKPIIKDSCESVDLFVFKQFKYSPICGIKVLELTYTNKFTNFSTSRLDDMFDYCVTEFDIKKLF